MDKKQEKKIGLIMAVIMSVCMGVIASVVIAGNPNANTPSFPVFLLINLVESVIVGILVALIIPLGKMGQAMTRKAKAAPGSLKFNLINSIPMTLGNSLIVSTIISFVNVAQAHSHIPAEQAPPLFVMWFGSWAPLLLPSILISYMIAVVISPIVVKWVMRQGH